MKTLHVTLLVLFFGMVAVGCKEKDDCPPHATTAATIEILPLGDSRVDGDPGNYPSYRYELWKNLVEGQWDTDFIGTRTDVGEYNRVEGRCFDNEHEGTGGATTTDILMTLRSVQFEKTPEVALVGIGGNDLLDGGATDATPVVSRVGEIIGELRRLNPNMVIFVEQIAPGMSSIMTTELTNVFNDFNNQVGVLADSLNSTASPVIKIDMAAGWTDSYLADDVHYNDAGAKIIADRYYLAIQQNVQR